MARVTVAPGVALNVEEAGTGGPPFVFVHGLACDSTAWAPQFADLARDHRCISVNLRGRGGSDATGPFGVPQQAADVAAVMQELGCGPAVIVGHSLGGYVALDLNQRHPEFVLGIVAGDSPIQRTGLGSARLADMIDEAGDTAPLDRLLERFWTENTTPAVREYARSMMLGCPPAVAAGMLRDDPSPDVLLAQLKAADQKPFMALWADPPIGDPAWFRAVCMLVRQEAVAGAGHFFQIEQPAVTNALLRAFLDDVERDPRLDKLGLR
ncbi:MAG: alpha/beta fold hydrolase [Dehalococcoidia bacterium]